MGLVGYGNDHFMPERIKFNKLHLIVRIDSIKLECPGKFRQKLQLSAKYSLIFAVIMFFSWIKHSAGL